MHLELNDIEYPSRPSLLQGIDNFKILSSLLGFCAKYDAESLAYDILGVLLKRWPTSLAGWDCRYQTKENFDPILDPLNPMLVPLHINIPSHPY